jgi:hypothetical protein
MYGATRPARAQLVTIDLPGRRTAAHRRPPSFFCVLLLLAFTAHAAPGGGYRLAGVMNVGEERIGFLELPSGGQVLVRRGSSVEGGTVTVFDERQLRIVFPDRTLVLDLTGGAADAARMSPMLGVSERPSENDHVLIRDVETAVVMDSLRQASGARAGATSAGGKRDVPAELGRRFALVANLPPNARVVQVNEQPVTTAAKALADIESTLASGGTARLNLAAAHGEVQPRVYLVPLPESQ